MGAVVKDVAAFALRTSAKQVLLQSGGISSAVLDSADFTGQTHHHWQLKSKVQAVSIGFVSQAFWVELKVEIIGE